MAWGRLGRQGLGTPRRLGPGAARAVIGTAWGRPGREPGAPEPFGPERICVGHRGVYWFDVVAHGQIAHGSMPHLGRSAIDDMAALIDAVAARLGPELAERVTAMPVVPDASRRASINVNAVAGGQVGQEQQRASHRRPRGRKAHSNPSHTTWSVLSVFYLSLQLFFDAQF